MKLQIMIESFLVLMYSLHESYADVPHNMSFYSQKLVDYIIKKVLDFPLDSNS